MALTTNTIRYGTDNFALNYTGMVSPKTSWDCSTAKSFPAFTVTKTIPDGTDARIAFLIDSTVYKLTNSTTLTALTTQSYTADSILEEGNTVAEIEALTDISAFVGKKVTPIIALTVPSDATAMPKVNLKLRGIANTAQNTNTETSPEYTLATDPVTIIDAKSSITVADGGSVVVTASLYDGTTWGSYVELSAIKGQKASKVKFQATYTVTQIGTGSAALASVAVTYNNSNSSVSGLAADIITSTRNLGMDVCYIRTTITHEQLKDASIKAYVSFRDAAKVRDHYSLGTGTGEKLVIALPDTGVDPNTLHIYAGSTEISSFDYNLKLNNVTVTAAKDVRIYGSYSYGFGAEKWLEMTAGSTEKYQLDDSLYSTNFIYALDDDVTAKQVAAVKYELNRLPGTATESLGTATGTEQVFVLTHDAQADTIAVPGASFYVNDSGLLVLTAPKGTELKATYSYTGNTTVAKGYAIAWNR